jgi:hypothetical protein
MDPLERSGGDGPGPLVAVVGGVLAALVLIWLVGIIIGTVVFLVRVAVLVALVIAGLWVWSKVTGD